MNISPPQPYSQRVHTNKGQQTPLQFGSGQPMPNHQTSVRAGHLVPSARCIDRPREFIRNHPRAVLGAFSVAALSEGIPNLVFGSLSTPANILAICIGAISAVAGATAAIFAAIRPSTQEAAISHQVTPLSSRQQRAQEIVEEAQV